MADVKTPDELKKLKREELDALAVEAGLVDAASFTSKDAVIAAVGRVQGGEDAAVVNEESKPTPKLASQYQVRVTNDFRATTSANRLSGGLSIAQDGDGYIGELTEDQLKELQADPYVTVTEPGVDEAEAAKARISKSSADAQRKADNTKAAKEAAKKPVEPKEIQAGTPGPVDKA